MFQSQLGLFNIPVSDKLVTNGFCKHLHALGRAVEFGGSSILILYECGQMGELKDLSD